MNLYSNDCLTHVFFRLVSRMRWLLGDPDALRVSKGALCQARYRLGARPLVELFRRVCKPLATPSTPQAFLFGLRLMALDATVMDVPDTPENVRAFGKRRTPRGESAWPQIRLVAISECSTHAVVEAGVWPHDFDERAAGTRLLRGVGEGVLLLWDRGFHSFEMVKAALARGAHLLGRLPATVKPLQTRTLTDGTKLVVLRRRRPPDEEELRTRGAHLSYGAHDPLHPGGSRPPRPSDRTSPDHLAAGPGSRPRSGRSSSPTTPAGSSSSPSMRSRPTSARPKSPCAPRGPWASSKKPTGFWWPTTWSGPS